MLRLNEQRLSRRLEDTSKFVSILKAQGVSEFPAKNRYRRGMRVEFTLSEVEWAPLEQFSRDRMLLLL